MNNILTFNRWTVVGVNKNELPFYPHFKGYMALLNAEPWVNQETGEVRYMSDEKVELFNSLDDAYGYVREHFIEGLAKHIEEGEWDKYDLY